MKRTVVLTGTEENIQRTIEMLDQLPVDQVEVRPLTQHEEDVLAVAVEEWHEICVDSWRDTRKHGLGEAGEGIEATREKDDAKKLLEIWSTK